VKYGVFREHERDRPELAEHVVEDRRTVVADRTMHELAVVVGVHDVASVHAAHRHVERQRARHGARPRIHAPGAQADSNAALEQRFDRLAIALVNPAVEVEQRSVEVAEEQLVR
jgi:hypothetical protein